MYKHGLSTDAPCATSCCCAARACAALWTAARSAGGGAGASDALPFHKSPTAYNTAAELYGAHSSFAHPRFRRGQEQWLASMKPRSSKKPKRSADDNKV